MIRLIALLALTLTLAGCGSIKKPPGTTTIDVSYDDLLNKKQIRLDVSLGVGDTLRVNLASNPSTGYQWGAQAQISDPAVIAQRDHYDSGPAGVHLPGAPGTATWTFQALATGITTVSTSYGQLWPGGAKNAWSFTAAVTVR
jgi:inhibitor of cysteine peptidase